MISVDSNYFDEEMIKDKDEGPLRKRLEEKMNMELE